jgi:hypothetical protein
MKDLLKQSLIAHTNYMTPRIFSDRKKLDFYNIMWYYIENSEHYDHVPPAVNNSDGGKLAKWTYDIVYNGLKERFL